MNTTHLGLADPPAALALLEAFHARDQTEGGLFNAYEKVLSYGLITAAYQRGWSETEQEVRSAPGRCDVVLPLARGGRMWIELKQWWFLHVEPYRWCTQAKWKVGPRADYEKLKAAKEIKSGDVRAILVMRAWDGPAGQAEAERWLDELQAMLPRGLTRSMLALRSARYVNRSEVAGDLVLWHEPVG